MAYELKKVELPSDDKRWKIVQAAMRRNGFKASALIESLHAAQSAFGFLDEPALRFVAESLQVPLSKVFGVATFYHLFTLKPQGKHACVVCTGTACYIKGASDILDAVDKEFQLKPGETTQDGQVSLLTARCIGACGIAAAGSFDQEVVGKLDSKSVLSKIRGWTKQ